jgi:SAM-dependent methyltransferase
MTSLLRRFIALNQRLSWGTDRLLLPDSMRVDGNRDFKVSVVPGVLRSGLRINDLGGGSNPHLDHKTKAELGLSVVGLDISEAELLAAPPGRYDRVIAADLCTFRGLGDADLVICQATLEHVPDNVGAMRAIAETLAPNGIACIFVPSRNATFARLNLILPESVKRRLLFALFPQKALGHDGFKAHYIHCTPAALERLARENGQDVVERRLYWVSSYFAILTPVFLIWRLCQGLFRLVAGAQAAETFVLVLRRGAVNRTSVSDAAERSFSSSAPGRQDCCPSRWPATGWIVTRLQRRRCRCLAQSIGLIKGEMS